MHEVQISKMKQNIKKLKHCIFIALIVVVFLPVRAQTMTRKPVPTPLSLAGLPAGSDPFMRIRETNLPDVARYWREQQAYGLATLGQLSTEEVSDAIRSKKAEPLFQSVVTMSTDAVYFSERGSDSRVRIVRREFESGKESVIWVASDQRWPLKMQLSPDKKRMAILLSGASSDILLTPVSDEEAEPVLLKDADSGSAMLWMDEIGRAHV